MNLVLTFDYELFGDGRGNVFNHLVEPMDQILGLCNEYNINTTIFFEVVEYLRLKEECDKGNLMGYANSPVYAIEQQIQKAAMDGHDIQLHLHPQWVNAKYLDGVWKVDMSNWRLGDFKKDNYRIYDLLKDSKNALENLIKPVKTDYKCIAFRAGGYNILPSAELYSAMQQIGLKMDSSVYPGGFENGILSKYDYRNVSEISDYWWADANDMRKPSNSEKGILEIPIFALPVNRWKRLLTISKIKSLLLNHNSAMSSVTKEKVGSKSINEKIKFLFAKESTLWDVCMLSKSLHKHYFKYIEKNLRNKRDTFVLIGHPKSLKNKNIFKNFMKTAITRKIQYKFLTLAEFYEHLI
ncbi:MAG: hypothetical protein ACOC2U_02170 [bacterium]